MVKICLGIPGKLEQIIEHNSHDKLGIVNFSGVKKKVVLNYLPAAKPDDYLLVHAGCAIAMIDEDEALKTLHYTDQLKDSF